MLPRNVPCASQATDPLNLGEATVQIDHQALVFLQLWVLVHDAVNIKQPQMQCAIFHTEDESSQVWTCHLSLLYETSMFQRYIIES